MPGSTVRHHAPDDEEAAAAARAVAPPSEQDRRIGTWNGIIYRCRVLMLAPLSTGLLLPGGLLMGAFAPMVGRLYDRYGARALVVPGTAATSGALWSTTLFGADSSIMLVVGFHMLLNVGLAFVTTPLFTVELGAVPPHLYSYGSAIFGATQQLHAAFVVAASLSLIAIPCAFFVRSPAASARARNCRAGERANHPTAEQLVHPARGPRPRRRVAMPHVIGPAGPAQPRPACPGLRLLQSVR